MNDQAKNRLVNVLLILLFLAVVSGCAYFIMKTMMRWRVEGLG